MQHRAVGDDPHESFRAQMLDDPGVHELGRARERERHVHPSARGFRHDLNGSAIGGVGLELAAADGADGPPDARPEQAHIVVDLGRRAYGGA